MLAYARRLLDLNDEAATAVRGGLSEEWIRLGLQEDFADILPAVLARFTGATRKSAWRRDLAVTLNSSGGSHPGISTSHSPGMMEATRHAARG
jgi:DNA-binding transcriptional LysR family regulator